MAGNNTFAGLFAEIRSNSRLRLGLWLIAGIAWFYGILLVRDETVLATSELQGVAKKLARVEAQALQDQWTGRAEAAVARQLELESQLWRESSLGLAQASFQDWLNQSVQQANLNRPLLTVASQEDHLPEAVDISTAQPSSERDIWKISAKLAFDFTPKSFYALMERFASHGKQVVVETLVIRGMPQPRAEMVLVAYFQKPAEGESGAAGAKPDPAP